MATALSRRFLFAARTAILCGLTLALPAAPSLAQGNGGILQQLPPGAAAQAQRLLQGGQQLGTDQIPGGTPDRPNQQIYVTPAPAAEQRLSALETLYSRRAGTRLTQFGYDLIGNGGTPVIISGISPQNLAAAQGAQAMMGSISSPQIGAVQDDYILGPGDQLNVTFRGDQNSAFVVPVGRDGTVALPNMTPIPAAGRSFGDFRADVERTVQQTYVRTRVFITVSQVRELTVRVVGDVTNPGAYVLNGLQTVLDALNLAGGIKKTGSLRNITLVRGSRTIRIDLYGMLMTGQSPDITIAQGDRIVVPAIGQTAAVTGDVRRPGIYELPPGAQSLPAESLLGLAQGTQISGVYRETLLRNRPDGRQEMVDISRGGQTGVRDGEVLMVRRAVDMSLGTVSLEGDVRLPGQFALSDNKTLHDLLPSMDVLAPEPYLLLGVIDRLDPNTLQRVPIAFSPLRVITGKENANLMSDDIVRIFTVRGGQVLAAQISARRQQALRQQTNIEIDRSAQQAAASSASQAGGFGGAAQGFGAAGQGAGASGQGQAPGATGQRGAGGQGGNAGNGASQGPGNMSGQPPFTGYTQNPVSGQAALPYSNFVPDSGNQNGQGPVPGAYDAESAASANAPGTPGPSNNAGAPANQGLQPNYTSRDLGGYPVEAVRMLVNRLAEFGVDLSGAVRQPGPYIAAPGTTVAELVATAGGLQADADLSQFEITASTIDNQNGHATVSRQTLPASPQQLSQIALKGSEEIIFHRVSSDQEGGDVRIAGEVRFPGTYHIIRGEHLSSLIRRAGGYLPTAYPYGSVFTRLSVAKAEDDAYSKEADEMESSLAAYAMSGTAAFASSGNNNSGGGLNPATSSYLETITERLRNTQSLGRLAIDADPAVLARRPDLDIALEPGDQLIVPRKPASVNVVGEVRNPSGIVFNADMGADDYIRAAGGATRLADDEGTFIIYPDGSSAPLSGGFWSIGSASMTPGSTIVVPRDVTPPVDWPDLASKLASIVGQLALTAASISIISH